VLMWFIVVPLPKGCGFRYLAVVIAFIFLFLYYRFLLFIVRAIIRLADLLQGLSQDLSACCLMQF